YARPAADESGVRVSAAPSRRGRAPTARPVESHGHRRLSRYRPTGRLGDGEAMRALPAVHEPASPRMRSARTDPALQDLAPPARRPHVYGAGAEGPGRGLWGAPPPQNGSALRLCSLLGRGATALAPSSRHGHGCVTASRRPPAVGAARVAPV